MSEQSEDKLYESGDVLDKALFKVLMQVDKAKHLSEVPKIVREAIRDVRQQGFRTCYVRDRNDKPRLAVQIYKDGKAQKVSRAAICEQIARLCEVTTSTAQRYYREFESGKDPDNMVFSFEGNNKVKTWQG